VALRKTLCIVVAYIIYTAGTNTNFKFEKCVIIDVDTLGFLSETFQWFHP